MSTPTDESEKEDAEDRSDEITDQNEKLTIDKKTGNGPILDSLEDLSTEEIDPEVIDHAVEDIETDSAIAEASDQELIDFDYDVVEIEPIQIDPEFILVKGDEIQVLSNIFQANDLITLVTLKTGDWMSTKVQMIDSRDQVRYNASSGGSSHKWTTRIQNTRTFGEWKFHITGPLYNSQDTFDLEIPFRLTDEIPEDIEEEVVIIEKTETGYEVRPPNVEEVLEIPYEGDAEKEAVDILYENEIVEEGIEKIEQLMKEKEPEKEIVVIFDYVNDDLPELKIPVVKTAGIGPSYERKLNAKEIYFIHELLNHSPEELSKLSGVAIGRCESWISFARDVANNPLNSVYLEYSKLKAKTESITPPSESVEVSIGDAEIPVNEIKGVGPSFQKKLGSIGIELAEQLAPYTAEELSEKIGVNASRIQKWLDQLPELLGSIQLVEPSEIQGVKPTRPDEPIDEELTDKAEDRDIHVIEVKGIGPSFEKKLNAVNINYIHQLIALTADEIAEKTGVSASRISKWLENAKSM